MLPLLLALGCGPRSAPAPAVPPPPNPLTLPDGPGPHPVVVLRSEARHWVEHLPAHGLATYTGDAPPQDMAGIAVLGEGLGVTEAARLASERSVDAVVLLSPGECQSVADLEVPVLAICGSLDPDRLSEELVAARPDALVLELPGLDASLSRADSVAPEVVRVVTRWLTEHLSD